jgi:hypothetical protein
MKKYEGLGFKFVEEMKGGEILAGCFNLPERTFLVTDNRNGNQWIEYDGKNILMVSDVIGIR